MITQILFPKLGIELILERAVSVFGFHIYIYGIIIAVGLAVAFWYASREVNKSELDREDFLNMFIIAVPVSVVCARLYYVVFNWEDYAGDIWKILNIRSGGIAIYGAVIGAALVVFIYCKIKNIGIGKVLDILAVGLIIGQAIGRWGNFVNGEAFGSATDLPWAMTIFSDGRLVAESVHPTFLYESLWNALGIMVLLLIKKRKKTDGEVFCSYMVWYGFGRMLIEGLRTDSLYIGDFRVSQLVAAASVIFGIVLILRMRKNIKSN